MIHIDQMKFEDIYSVMEIWHIQFDEYCGNIFFPDFWSGGKETIKTYLIQQIDNGSAIVARSDKKIVGYMAWMIFDFHGERTAFCPIIGHGAFDENKEKIYIALYSSASTIWVKNKIFNHLWMIFNEDVQLKSFSYDLGFGSYVMDACHKISSNQFNFQNNYRISKVVPGDVDALLKFANETNKYYSDAPIFLKREIYTKKFIVELQKRDGCLIAWDRNDIVGVISFSINSGYHFEKLTNSDSCCIKYIGAFVKTEYRSRGIATALLKEVNDHCLTIGKKYLHVSYETSNPIANKFWPKYFIPAIRSVRRTINKDASDSL